MFKEFSQLFSLDWIEYHLESWPPSPGGLGKISTVNNSANNEIKIIFGFFFTQEIAPIPARKAK